MSCMRVLIVTFLAVAWLSLGQIAWAIGTTPPSWEPREVVANALITSTEHTTQDRLLAYDHHGIPGIAFSDTVGRDLRYARRVPGVGWVHSTVDTQGLVGAFPSLAYDRYERPTISYRGDSDLKFAHFNGSTWDIETVDSIGSVGLYTSLAFDVLGHAAIAYHDFTNRSLKYVRDTDGDFSLLDETTVTVTDLGSKGFFPSLVFDPLNRPMIAHRENINSNLLFTVEEPGVGWVTTTVDETLGNLSISQHSIDIDPDTGFPAIAYSNALLNDLRYAEWDGANWSRTIVDGLGTSGRYPSLAFDPADGNPAISYQANFEDLNLAWHDGSSWQTQTVDSVGELATATSLAFNDFGSGFPSIAYVVEESTGFDSLYFIDDPSAALPEPSPVAMLMLGAVFVPSLRRRRARPV